MKNFVLDYVNENEFRKLERSLKKYNMRAFKKLSFDYYPDMRNGKFPGELVSKNEVKLIYTVYKKEETVMLKELLPKDILLEGHRSELGTYKGIMISKANASKDIFKIDLLNMLQGKE